MILLIIVFVLIFKCKGNSRKLTSVLNVRKLKEEVLSEKIVLNGTKRELKEIIAIMPIEY